VATDATDYRAVAAPAPKTVAETAHARHNLRGMAFALQERQLLQQPHGPISGH